MRPLRDGAGAKTDDHIAWLDDIRDRLRQVFRPFDGPRHAVAPRREAGSKRIAVEAVNRCFARCVDRRNEHRIGVVETSAEAFEEVAQPGVAVRLDDGDDPV